MWPPASTDVTMKPTATTSERLPWRLADFATLTEALDYAARGETGCNFFSARGELTAVLPYAELRERAVALARGLIKAGLPRGSRVMMLADTDPNVLVLWYYFWTRPVEKSSAQLLTSFEPVVSANYQGLKFNASF
jgi:hypothetical protein